MPIELVLFLDDGQHLVGASCEVRDASGDAVICVWPFVGAADGWDWAAGAQLLLERSLIRWGASQLPPFPDSC